MFDINCPVVELYFCTTNEPVKLYPTLSVPIDCEINIADPKSPLSIKSTTTSSPLSTKLLIEYSIKYISPVMVSVDSVIFKILASLKLKVAPGYISCEVKASELVINLSPSEPVTFKFTWISILLEAGVDKDDVNWFGPPLWKGVEKFIVKVVSSLCDTISSPKSYSHSNSAVTLIEEVPK